jgi:cytochrome c556
MSQTPISSRRWARAAILVTTGAVAMLALRALAADQPKGPSPAEQQINYRKALYTVMATNFGPVYAMASGKMPYDAAALTKRAERVKFIAAILPEAFPEGSGSGAPTRALPEIWTNRAEFDRLMQALVEKTTALATAAASGDLKQIQPATNAVGTACKNCHDKFRKEED